jgi:hypothetical protein
MFFSSITAQMMVSRLEIQRENLFVFAGRDGLDQERVACGKTCPESRHGFSRINLLIFPKLGLSV